MKILMVLDEEFPPDVRVEKEISVLSKAGHQVDLLCYTLTGQPQTEERDGVRVFRVRIPRMTYKLKALALQLPTYFSYWKKHIRDRLGKEAYDVLHFHDLNLVRVALEAGREKGIPVVGDYHENRPEIMEYYHHVKTFPGRALISVDRWRRFQTTFTPLLDHLVLVTDEARSYYRETYGMDAEKITVVENFPHADALLSYPADNMVTEKYKGKKMLLYFGDTGIRRGTDTILETARLFRDDDQYRFVIMGTSREQTMLEDMKERLGLDNVELTGFVPLSTAASYFRSAFAGLSPLHRNIHHDTTYANKVFQYMAFGLPVIVSDCPAQAWVIQDSECGLVHEAGNARDLAAKIRKLEDPGLHERLGSRAAEAVKIKYNFTAAGRKLVELYDRIKNETQGD